MDDAIELVGCEVSRCFVMACMFAYDRCELWSYHVASVCFCTHMIDQLFRGQSVVTSGHPIPPRFLHQEFIAIGFGTPAARQFI